MQLEAYAATDVGPVRENNEDNFLVDVEGGVFVVADGMGGHAAGEVASQIAVETIQDILIGADDPDETRVQMTAEDPEEAVRERLRYCMNQASVRIRKAIREEPAYRRMGTTLVLLLVDGETAYLGHVGDSRAYLFRDGRIQLLTRDHTVVQQEMDAGRLTPELARIVPHKNILTRSVGAQGPVDPDIHTRPLTQGDLFILCSDGLTDPLEDEAIANICRETHPEDLAQKLVDEALRHGGEDNVTVVIVSVS
jgi:serine/threonine protein phosphatase PrpC